MLIKNLKRLATIGNSVIVVEHDEDIMRECDYIIDIGPRAGVHGGEVIFS
jgi:excinuclease ABC subunit A